MKAAEILMEEHRVIERVLASLELAANSLGSGRAVTADFDRVEHEETGEGIHEKYLGVATELEKAVRG